MPPRINPILRIPSDNGSMASANPSIFDESSSSASWDSLVIRLMILVMAVIFSVVSTSENSASLFKASFPSSSFSSCVLNPNAAAIPLKNDPRILPTPSNSSPTFSIPLRIAPIVSTSLPAIRSTTPSTNSNIPPLAAISPSITPIPAINEIMVETVAPT